MTRRWLLILLFISLTFSLACQGSNKSVEVVPPSPMPSPSPTKDPRNSVAGEEARSQIDYSADGTFDKSRPAVRQAARQFVITELPKWTLKGMASQSYESNVFWVDVDLENGQQKKVLSLIVRQFFPESGESYWKAFPVDRTHASQLHFAHDAETQRQLNEANDQVQRYENGEKP